MNTWNNRSLEGCLLEQQTLSPAALVMEQNNVQLPGHVDLRPHCSPVEDQGQTQSCTANAVVGALEYHQRQAQLPVTDLSRMFVYYNARKLLDRQNEDCGSFIHHVMASVLAYGACEERIWPFDPQLCLVQPSAEAYQNATQHQAIQYCRAPLGEASLTALANGIPVVFGTYLPSDFYAVAAQTGSMPMPGPVLAPGAGGHAMLLVGYDLNQRYWIVRNSYGPQFGNRGYFRIPFETLAAYSVPVHFWTIGAIEATSMVIKPNTVPAFDFDAPSHLEIDLNQMRSSIRETLSSKVVAARDRFRSSLRS